MLSLADGFAQSALQPELWLPSLAALADATGSRRAELVGIGPPARAFTLITDVNEGVWADAGSFNLADPRLNFRIAAGMRAGLGEVAHEHHYAEAIAGLANHVYVDFCHAHEMINGCQTNLMVGSDLLVGMSVLRGEKSGSTRDADRALLAALTPHVATAVRTQAALESQGFDLLRGALEAMSVVAFILDFQGRVRAMTPAAESLVADGAGLGLSHGRLRSAIAIQDAELARAIAVAASPGGGAQALTLRTPRSGPVISLEILPLPQGPFAFGFKPRVLVTARMGRTVRPLAAKLVQGFGLTPAEADVAEQLARGIPREVVAETRGVTLETVRVQLKVIYRKMDVRREGELISKINAQS